MARPHHLLCVFSAVTGNNQCKDSRMKPPLPRTLSAVPQTMHTRLEIAKAIRTLAGPDEDELLRQRHAEIAAIRRDLEALSRDLHKAFEAAATLAKAELRSALKKYSADQPRVPAGNPDGGQWTTGPGTQLAANDSSPQKPIDLRDEEAPIGKGHAISEHVGKSDVELLAQMIGKTWRSAGVYDRREGSFDSIESANYLVNSALDAPKNVAEVAAVASGIVRNQWLITLDIPGSVTGRELYRSSPDTEPYMRVTDGVGVVIQYDPTRPRGYRIVTAYPRTGPVEQK
jgi:Bacterial CdiA-CT RNAse A domain